MGKFITWLTSVWSVILIISILLFVFWGGPVFSATALGHGGRLIVSYSFIPLAVAAVLIWRKKWEWAVFAYYTIGIALIKMVITMGVFVGASPRRASGIAKPIDRVVGAAHQEGSYRTVETNRWGYLRGRVHTGTTVQDLVVAITNIQAGKAPRHTMHNVSITNGTASPQYLSATVGDSLVVSNHDNALHTFGVSGEGGALFQLPLAPAKSSPAQAFVRQGMFSSHCSQGHADEITRIAVFAHPYHSAIAPDGTFALDSIPPGRYQVAVYEMNDETAVMRYEAITRADIAVVAPDTSTTELILTERKGDDSAR